MRSSSAAKATATARERDAALAATYRDTAIAAGALTTGPFLQEALRHLGRLSKSPCCSILLAEDGRLRHGASCGLAAEFVAMMDDVGIAPNVGACGAAAATARPCVTADIRTDPNWASFRGAADAAGLRTCWSVPIMLPGGEVLGTFASYGHALAPPSPGSLEAAQEYAPIVALGLQSIQRQRELARNYEAIVLALTSALDSRDEYTAAHSSETAALVGRVGARLGLGSADLETLARVAVLHDIGKLGIPTEILGKAGPLNAQEWEVMRRHPAIGERILVRVPFLGDVAKAVRHEHERWDGGGYPDGLAGEQIPAASRIVFVCDSFHAMTSDRPYRTAMSLERACAELREHAGSQFDPAVVTALLAELGESIAEPLPAGHTVHAQAREHALGAVAAEAGASDLFVFRPGPDGTWRHVDGVGRGSGWAGNVELRPEQEPHLRALLEGRADALVVEGHRPVQIVGPYFAACAVLVQVDRNEVVVLGSTSGALARHDPGLLRQLACRAGRAVEVVPPAKQLADELEVLDAVRAVTTVASEALQGALTAVAECAAAALSCEFAAVATVPAGGGPPVVGWAGPGWTPEHPDLVTRAMAGLVARRDELPLLAQDTATGPPRVELDGFSARDGITSLQALPVGGEAVAVLLVAHASSTPRGFTTLCRRVAGAMADAAEAVVRRALAQERLAAENSELAKRVATDPLTGVASRGWWEERLAQHTDDAAAPGEAWAVIVVDVDGLKELNDRAGHQAGDELLRACAAMLVAACRGEDRVARIGGDEFAVLLQGVTAEHAAAWCERLRERAADHAARTPDLPLAFSVGWGITSPEAGLYAALARADEQMYEDKRERRARPPVAAGRLEVAQRAG